MKVKKFHFQQDNWLSIKPITEMEEEKKNETSPLFTDEVYTKRKPLTKITYTLIFTVFVISLGSFQFGYNIGVINSPQAAISGKGLNCTTDGFFKPCVPMSDPQYGVFVSITFIGALIGGLSSGSISDFIGRRTTLFISNIFFIIGSLLISLFSNFYVFITGRLIIGFGIGFTSVVVPLYIAEISPDDMRGSFGTVHQFMIVGAILLTSILGIFLSNNPGWRILFAIPVVISILQMVLLPFCPMSPKWLVSKGWTESANTALYRLRGTEESHGELESPSNEDDKPKGFAIFKIFRRTLIKPLFVGVLLHVTQQFSGINVVIFYSTGIFKDSGVDNPALATVIVGVVNIGFTALSIYLVEKLGRKKLLLSSIIISAISFCVLATSYILKEYNIGKKYMSLLSVIAILVYIAGFAIGLGPIPWIMLSELYPSDVRGICQGLITGVNWICTFTIGIAFPPLRDLLKAFTFLPFAIFLIISIFFAYFFVPETKGKSIEELTENL